MKNLSEKVQEFGLKKAISYLDSDPDKNIPKLLNWLEKFDKDGYYESAYNSTRMAIEQQNNWYKLIKSLYIDIDDGVRKKIFENFIINASILGVKRQNKSRKEHGCNVPWAILMDPTSACNLHCTGCWAAEYGNKLSMDFDTLDSIIKQGKELGTYMYIYSGGEPLVRKKDIIELCEKHNDCIFLAFTNATLIDEKFADEMLRVKNFIPAMSVEGFEEETDMRRGQGTYKAVIKAMDTLREKKLPFGFSTCYHSKNAEVIGSEEYFDKMIEKGCKFGWIFTYMPVGCDAVPELLATAEQREFMYYQVRNFRKTKSLFTLDFWNDGEYVEGCIAGGRRYLHINANGDVEPCAFIHYSNINIKENTLLEALKSPLFMQYKQNQPFNNNHLSPCPLLDNPGRLADMVEKSNAHSTDIINPEDVRDLSAKCLDAAKNWEPVSDKLWECSHGCCQCNK
ncbi:radical SAM protein [Abyssisolibacter fermentans]|uniref:radical SAM protein n=1 Tax=Abyssisolibacter fermentans TaxID=1766203 RepID=UPI00082D257A|nr:radical SAM protein [Abyssisolibacter fermentans]